MDTYTLEHYVHSKLKEARAASARAALAAAARAEQPPSRMDAEPDPRNSTRGRLS